MFSIWFINNKLVLQYKAAITFSRNVCVIITDGHPLKIAQLRNGWVYYMYAFLER